MHPILYTLAAAGAGIGLGKYGVPALRDFTGASRPSGFTHPNTITAAAKAYDWANSSMQPIEAWELLKNKPEKFINESYWTDRDSYGDYAAQVYYDLTRTDPNSIYDLGLDQMKDAVRAFRNGDRVSDNHNAYANNNFPVFDVNTTNVEQTRKDLLALSNMLYAYRMYGTSGQSALANAIIKQGKENISRAALEEFRDAYTSNKNKLAIGDFSGLNLKDDNFNLLIKDLESKKKNIQPASTKTPVKGDNAPAPIVFPGLEEDY